MRRLRIPVVVVLCLGLVAADLAACRSSSPAEAPARQGARTTPDRSRPAARPRPVVRPRPPLGTARPGVLAWLPVDPHAFATPAFDVKAALALLGRPNPPGSSLQKSVELVPHVRHKNLKAVTLRITGGRLTGIKLNFKRKVRVPRAALTRTLGHSTANYTAFYHLEDFGNPMEKRRRFELKSATHSVLLYLWYWTTESTPKVLEVHQVSLSRRPLGR